jgi:SAM-dependent methyltransferase
VQLHVEQARQAAASDPAAAFAAVVGDARELSEPDQSQDAVLLFGPLYHLTGAAHRRKALAEARRVLRPGGVVVAAAISRHASLLDGVCRGLIDDPEFLPILERDLREGQHRNPTSRLEYFTTAYFHLPAELGEEARAAGLTVDAVLAVEGPAWLIPDLETRWRDEGRRRQLLDLLRRIEADPAVLAMSAHLLLVARRA